MIFFKGKWGSGGDLFLHFYLGPADATADANTDTNAYNTKK